MKKLTAFFVFVLLAASAFAQESPSPAQTLLRNIGRIRAGMEQEEERDAEKLRANTGQSTAWREPGTSLAEMRARVTDNVRNIREPFRCLDVDIEKNAGPVVLVCGNNSGTSAALQQTTSNSGNTVVTTLPTTQP